MIELPEAFKKKMKGLLETEYEAFLESYEKERVQGLRLNPGKAEAEEFLAKAPFHLTKIPWAKEGYYYDSGDRPGKHPYHEAGLYYIQEPSAMAVVELLEPKPGDCVLDLCAAPGGKTTQIAGHLLGEGFLLSNEIHPARAKILSQNVERMGIRNAVVANETPERLAERFPQFFDKIVVDAPCSGEGMFRKDEEARSQWSPDHVIMCAARQRQILDHAAQMLKAGGRMVYSTCTFSPEEDEQTIETFLSDHPEFEIEDMGTREGLSPGRPEWGILSMETLRKTYRIWPHLSEGEGHYLAVLRKTGKDDGTWKRKVPKYLKDKAVWKEYEGFCRELFTEPERYLDREEYILFGDQLYLLPPQMIDLAGLKVVRPGLHMGSMKKNRFEPSHALALSMKEEEAVRCFSMKADGRETVRYLKGETLRIEEAKNCDLNGQKGWVLMTVDGWSLGFSKLAGGILKNHYPKGLRWMGGTVFVS